LNSFQPKSISNSTENQFQTQPNRSTGLDECKIVVVGGSPTPGHIYEFIKVLLFDGWAVSGYGSTESSAGVSITTHGDYTVGSIGSTIPALHWRLASVPDLEYFHSDDKGELLVHGSTTFTGYFKNDEETAKAFVVDSKGRQWYRTGDIARINPNGGLSIIDRKKSLLKLSQGGMFFFWLSWFQSFGLNGFEFVRFVFSHSSSHTTFTHFQFILNNQ
jgi:long-subunit acyl-CoA synthetase (AMP-forming)